MWTVLPARASRSPHIEPDGPPPTITISAMGYLSLCCETESPGAKPSGDGQYRQGKTSEQYSTEDCGGGSRACPDPYYIHCHSLQNRKQHKIDHQQYEGELRRVQIENSRNQREPENRAKNERVRDTNQTRMVCRTSEGNLLGKVPGKQREKQNRKPQPARRSQPGFIQCQFVPRCEE